MCGITGFISQSSIDYNAVLLKMVEKLNHRGPDSHGVWYDNNHAIGFGHARLSIVDLSETGHQPMISFSKRYSMVFNGEIYNHNSIRETIELERTINWKGTSDTETILTAIEIWGIEKTIESCIGMFAIALWDSSEKQLTLIRDRMGEKPLYYGWVNENFVFASELSSIKSFPLFNNQINRDALMLYLRHCSIPDPYSIYENIYKLEPGCSIVIKLGKKEIIKKQYWSTEKIANQNNSPTFIGTAHDAVQELEKLLKNAVKIQMQADVPIGAFLSGGVDSSAIVALMQSQSEKKVNTFTIGFDQKQYNEAEHAKKVAAHIGTNHHEAYMSNKEILDIVPLLPKIYSEPFSESSQIPTFLVSKIAKQKVTVSLSGDAGDELFCGYSRYQLADKSWSKISKIPYFVRKKVSSGINLFPQNFWQTVLQPLNSRKDKNGIQINPADKLLKAAPLLAFKNRKEFYSKGFMTHNLDAINWVIGSKESNTIFDTNSIQIDNYLSEMMTIDQLTYLTNNNLTKVDRAAMANSLETRVPMLDHNIVSFAHSIPIEYKLRDGVDKWVLREVLYKYVPKQLIERPKMGFGVPLAEWLRGPLRDWCENLINQKRLEEEGFFDAKIIRTKWQEHLSGKRNWENQLWDVMVFQDWLDEQKNNA